MKRIAFAAMLLAVLSVACVTVAADEPKTNIKLTFACDHVPGHEAEGKAAWNAFCQTIGAVNPQWIVTRSSMPGRGDHGGGICVLSLTNAQFTTMLDALRVLASNAAFQHCVADFRVTF